jgi:hypothetical protein
LLDGTEVQRAREESRRQCSRLERAGGISRGDSRTAPICWSRRRTRRGRAWGSWRT